MFAIHRFAKRCRVRLHRIDSTACTDSVRNPFRLRNLLRRNFEPPPRPPRTALVRHRLGIATRAEIEDHRVVLQRANPKPGAAPDELSGRRDRLAAPVRRAPRRHSARGGLLGVG